MALDFTGGDTDRVLHGSDASIDNVNTGSFLFLINLDSTAGTSVIFSKLTASETGKIAKIVSGGFNFTIHGTTGDCEGNINSTLSTGKWVWVACTWDGVTNAPDSYYADDIWTPLALDNGFQGTGSGTPVDESANQLGIGSYIYGTGPTFDGLSINGRIARFMLFDAKLSLLELQIAQFHPDQRGNVKLWSEYGYFPPGTGTQLDLTGNGNTGAVTGATAADHAPLAIPKFMAHRNYGTLAAVGAANPKGPISMPIGRPIAGPIG